ncbi:S8 family peptidase [Pseudomarimonas arenosa]|uniref:S8/S53 family peptidase n=1 Tax=Pseudomarimonas arenosa TaxID=2774145 RepID=A0AAW3ZQ51_9GAMM|nr:S8/S53 family peptidase [Pseudomarimonas arenosa]MBD8527660.1 S8/S53 family peptidase [Pseudomarimonas arenosa]
MEGVIQIRGLAIEFDGTEATLERIKAGIPAATRALLTDAFRLDQSDPTSMVLRVEPDSTRTLTQEEYRAARDSIQGLAEVEPYAIVQGMLEPRIDSSETTAEFESFGYPSSDLPGTEDPLWHHERAGVSAAHALGATGMGVLVGHPDTGYTDHWELSSPRIRADIGHNFVEDSADPTDLLHGGNPGHGTATASVLMSGLADRGDLEPEEVAGVALGAELVPIRTIRHVALIAFHDVARAIHHAVDQGCHVISMSLGGVRVFPFDGLKKAVRRARDNGVIVVAAAGNAPAKDVVAPANLDDVIAVAATTIKDEPAVWSCRGPEVDLCAPGESVWRAHINGKGAKGTGRGHGTSYATAMVAGAACLWLQHHERDSLLGMYGRRGLVAAFKQILTTPGQGVRRPPAWDTERWGAGILDARGLLDAPLPPPR